MLSWMKLKISKKIVRHDVRGTVDGKMNRRKAAWRRAAS